MTEARSQSQQQSTVCSYRGRRKDSFIPEPSQISGPTRHEQAQQEVLYMFISCQRLKEEYCIERGTAQGIIMSWHPVTKEEFDNVLHKAIAEMPTHFLPTYRLSTIEPVEQRCFRNSEYGIEHVFVVARAGQSLLLFDDVEEEFAVRVPDTDGILRHWVLYGPLDVALRSLSEASS